MAAKTDERPIILKVENVGKKYIIKNMRTMPENPTKLQKIRYRMKKMEKNDFWALKSAKATGLRSSDATAPGNRRF